MNEAIDPQTISEEERERVFLRAENDPVFRDIARTCADLVDQYGYPERNVEAVFGDNRDVIVLFRMFRTAAMVNRRLAGKPVEERLTEREWSERRIREARRQMMALGSSQMQAMQSGLGMANMAPRWLPPPPIKIPTECESVIEDSVLANFGIAAKPSSELKDRMRNALGSMVKELTKLTE